MKSRLYLTHNDEAGPTMPANLTPQYHKAEDAFRRATEAGLAGAKPLAQNAFKVELGKRAIVRALMRASGQA